MPPMSVTTALTWLNTGPQLGDVVGHTNISPTLTVPIRLTSKTTRARPSATFGAAGKPFNSVILLTSTATALCHIAIFSVVIPQSPIRNGSAMTSGATPSAAGGFHSANLWTVSLRHLISGFQYHTDWALLPGAHSIFA